jgi:hypothetical protein
VGKFWPLCTWQPLAYLLFLFPLYLEKATRQVPEVERSSSEGQKERPTNQKNDGHHRLVQRSATVSQQSPNLSQKGHFLRKILAMAKTSLSQYHRQVQGCGRRRHASPGEESQASEMSTDPQLFSRRRTTRQTSHHVRQRRTQCIRGHIETAVYM